MPPLPGFGSRDDLIGDLAAALEPGRRSSVLAIFDLGGSDDYRRVHGEDASDALIASLAEEFARIVQPSGRCYGTRQDEFCALFNHPIDAVAPILAAAAIAIRREGELSFITTSFGVALLPDEAVEPLAALIAADQHLTEARRERERRTRHRSG